MFVERPDKRNLHNAFLLSMMAKQRKNSTHIRLLCGREHLAGGASLPNEGDMVTGFNMTSLEL